jgi:hypothetical protein
MVPSSSGILVMLIGLACHVRSRAALVALTSVLKGT